MWGEAIGNYDELRFFTGLRQSEQIALRVSDYDHILSTLYVRVTVVLAHDKDRTKTNEDRLITLCPRANAVVKRQLALREVYKAAGRIQHDLIFLSR